MENWDSLLVFIIDLAFLAPPLDDAIITFIPQPFPVELLFASFIFFVFSMMKGTLFNAFPSGKVIGMTMAVSITGLSILPFLTDQKELRPFIMFPIYWFTVSLRGIEGLILGFALRSKRWLLLPALLIIFILLLNVTLGAIQVELISLIKGIWLIAGASIASFKWTSALKGGLFADNISAVAFFLGLLTTALYIQVSQPEVLTLFQWSLPIGFVAGSIVRVYEHHKKISRLAYRDRDAHH
jgi:hypothetical protein